MKDKEGLIRQFVEAISARGKDPDTLFLPDWELASWQNLMADAEAMALSDGELLLRRGAESSDIYFLVAGKLEVSVPRSDSISMSPLISIGPGSIVGELSFLDDHGRSASVWSRGQTSLLRLHRETFESFKVAHPLLACDLVFAIGRIVAERLRRAQGASSDFAAVHA